MPPLNGFIGEVTILGGAYQMSFNWAFWAAVGIALGVGVPAGGLGDGLLFARAAGLLG